MGLPSPNQLYIERYALQRSYSMEEHNYDK